MSFAKMSLFYRLLVKMYHVVTSVSFGLLQFFTGLLLRHVPRATIHKLFVEHRTLIIMLVVVPLSFVYDLVARLRNLIVWSFFQSNVLHEVKVQNIQSQVLEWRKSGSTKKMCTNRSIFGSMSLRLSTFKRDCTKIDIDLHDIIEIDLNRKIVRLEPCVNMGQITDHLNKLGWTLALTIEMEDLTVGGLLMGMGVENNSHRYGMLHETCVAYEIVTGDGQLLRCTEQENSDLFKALPGSHGTLGFLVAAELRIIPCKDWLKVNYIPCKSQQEFESKMQQLTTDRETAPGYVEATIYSRTKSVIFTADFVDAPTGAERSKINRLNLWFKPWFYKHVESFLLTGADYEIIPRRDWFHRHTRSIFWELEDLIPFGNAPLYRYTWGILGAPKISLLKSVLTREVRHDLVYKHVVQDIVVPLKEVRAAIDLSDQLFGCYPLLFYPIRMFPHVPEVMIKNPKELINGDPNEGQMYFDLGIYGVPRCVREGRTYDGPTEVRKLDQFARDRNGFLLLYTDLFCTEEEFEQTFNFELYNQCREKYNAKSAFPTIWQKVKPDFSTFMD